MANRITKEDREFYLKTVLIPEIEETTDFDVLNFSASEIDIMNRYDNDEETITIKIGGKTTDQIIDEIKTI